MLHNQVFLNNKYCHKNAKTNCFYLSCGALNTNNGAQFANLWLCGPSRAMEYAEFLNCYISQINYTYFKECIFKASDQNQISYEWIALQQNSQNGRWSSISILGFSLFSALDILKTSQNGSVHATQASHCYRFRH